MGPEAKVKANIKGYLRTLPACWFFMPATHGYGTSGTPDIVGCYRGVFFAVEVKAPGRIKSATVLQKLAIKSINEAQGWAIVADGLPAVVEMIRLIDVSLGTAAA